MHRARELLRWVIAEKGTEQGCLEVGDIKDERNLEGVDCTKPRGGPSEFVHVRAAGCASAGMGIRQANGGYAHPPVGLNRGEQVTGTCRRIPRRVRRQSGRGDQPISGQALITVPANRPRQDLVSDLADGTLAGYTVFCTAVASSYSSMSSSVVGGVAVGRESVDIVRFTPECPILVGAVGFVRGLPRADSRF